MNRSAYGEQNRLRTGQTLPHAKEKKESFVATNCCMQLLFWSYRHYHLPQRSAMIFQTAATHSLYTDALRYINGHLLENCRPAGLLRQQHCSCNLTPKVTAVRGSLLMPPTEQQEPPCTTHPVWYGEQLSIQQSTPATAVGIFKVQHVCISQCDTQNAMPDHACSMTHHTDSTCMTHSKNSDSLKIFEQNSRKG